MTTKRPLLLLCITNLVSLLVTTVAVIIARASRQRTSDELGIRRLVQPDECCTCADDLSLTEVDGTIITADSMRCLYRATFGAREEITLRLLYVDPTSLSSLAFALYMTNPIPATPFDASAGSAQAGVFDFEVYPPAGGHYFTILQNNEIRVELDDFPAPASLQQGEVVSLKGKLVVPNEFTLPASEFNPLGLADGLDLSSDRVDINCEATFRRIETFA